jgi:antitoxin HigA-1
MKAIIDSIKGIHPGYILERELQKRYLAKAQFAISLGEFPQTLTAITKGKCRMNTPLALKIEKSLSLEEGYLMILQVYYDIEQEKKKENRNLKKGIPDLKVLRPVLFWDKITIHATDLPDNLTEKEQMLKKS